MSKIFIGIFLSLFSISAFSATVEVRIEKMKFVPQEIRIKAGDTVEWKNYEKRGYHTVVLKSEGAVESDPMFPEESWKRKFDKKGEFPYYCGPHEEMTGVVIVE